VFEFARFVRAAGYRTLAERIGHSDVWIGAKPEDFFPDNDALWISVKGASWMRPRGPDSHVRDKANHPVSHIAYEDALAFCAWSKTRLPTEAEWEKAARGTSGRVYAWGDKKDAGCNCNMILGDTSRVGAYPDATSPYGLLDVAGNVWEWTSSPYCKYPFDPEKIRSDGSLADGIIEDLSSFYAAKDLVPEVKTLGRLPDEFKDRLARVDVRVMRGGSFFNNICGPEDARCAARIYALATYSSFDLGFRVAR
jgi:formylglycine-generating enzyme required for sulfatase activity